MQKIAFSSLLLSALLCAPFGSAGSAGRTGQEVKLKYEEHVTVHGERSYEDVCTAAVPFYVIDAKGKPVNAVSREDLAASLYLDGKTHSLPVQNVYPGEDRIRMTILVDATPAVMNHHRNEIVDTISGIYAGLRAGDEMHFLAYGGDRKCNGRDDDPLGNPGCYRVQPKLLSSVRIEVRKPEGATREEIEATVKPIIDNIVPNGIGDIRIDYPLKEIINSISGFGRNHLVAITDGRYACDNSSAGLSFGASSKYKALTVSLVITTPLEGIESIVPGVYYLNSGSPEEAANGIINGIPESIVAVVDMREVCGDVPNPANIELRHKNDALDVIYPKSSEVMTPYQIVSDIRNLRNSQNGNSLDIITRRLQRLRGTDAGNYIMDALRLALNREKDPDKRLEFVKAMESLGMPPDQMK